MALDDNTPLDAEAVRDSPCHPGRQYDQSRNHLVSGCQREALQAVARGYVKSLIDDQAGWIRDQPPGGGNDWRIMKPVTLAPADVDDLATPDIEHGIERAGILRECIEQSEPAQDIDLLAAKLFDAEFFGVDGALVDQRNSISGPREDSGCERTCQSAAHDGYISHDGCGLAPGGFYSVRADGLHACPVFALGSSDSAISMPVAALRAGRDQFQILGLTRVPPH